VTPGAALPEPASGPVPPHAHVPGPVTLRTDRLVLRQWRESDVAPFAAMGADPEVMRHFPSLLTAEQVDAAVARFSHRIATTGWGLWALERDGEFIGFTGLSVPSFEAAFTPCTEIGWRLARHAWGKGYATEAARAALAFGFERLELPEIVSFTAVQNAPSRAVMERIGMVRDPADDFAHPTLPVDSPVSAHVLYRIARLADAPVTK
jgi:RimJ/RimL family protein N-acetyltransferase